RLLHIAPHCLAHIAWGDAGDRPAVARESNVDDWRRAVWRRRAEWPVVQQIVDLHRIAIKSEIDSRRVTARHLGQLRKDDAVAGVIDLQRLRDGRGARS